MNSQEYDRAVNLVLTERRAGAAFIKSKLLLSDSKVARLLVEMEISGVVSPMTSGGARLVLQPRPLPLPSTLDERAGIEPKQPLRLIKNDASTDRNTNNAPALN